MSGENQKGFTIIETSMFLAISALLFVGLISGVSVVIERQRYTDSVQSTYSFLQKQFNETLNVVNNRPTEEDCEVANKIRGASDCVVLGKLISFSLNSSEITTRTIIGEEPSPMPDDPTLLDFSPTLKEDVNEEGYSIPWSAQIIAANKRTGGFSMAVNAIAIIRSPITGTTSVYAFDSSNSINSDNHLLQSAIDGIATEDDPAIICLSSRDIINSRSVFTFNGTGSQDGLILKSDATEGDCDG